MIRKYLVCFLFLSLVLNVNGYAQDEDLRSKVDYKIDKMKKELNLTEAQAYAIKPIIKDYLTKRASVLDQVEGQGIVDHVSVKSTLKGLKEDEYQKLSKILSQDQMKKMINKDNLMATLNPDSMESSIDDGVSLTPSGANFKF